MVQAGTLDDPNAVTPTVAIYVKDALSRDRIDAAVAKFEHLPPAAPRVCPSCVRIRAFEPVMAGC